MERRSQCRQSAHFKKPIRVVPEDLTVTEPTPRVYRFTGGKVLIVDRTGKVRNHVWIVCPNLDEFVVTWTSPARRARGPRIAW